MYVSRITKSAEDEGSLAQVQATLAELAAGLDPRFVEAGGALAEAYRIVETLVASLEGVTGALDGEGTAAAVQDMRAVADRLTRLPSMQEERQGALRVIGGAGEALRGPLAQFNRTLQFLRICGLNIKVAAAGAAEFSGFADTMVEKIEIAETQMTGFGRDIDGLANGISEALHAETLLASECVKVVPEVPMRLGRDALALQEQQARLGELAGRTAEVARDIRTKLATALGALQIGDITRQRLEHVVTGLSTVDAVLAAQDALVPEEAKLAEDHALALLAAQAADAVGDFRGQARVLAQNLHAIGPRTAALLALREDDDAGDGENVLDVLEGSIAQIGSVTGRLQRADALSDQLSGATTATAESLGRRIAAVQRVKNDVQQMAWNTDLRCRRMGAEGQGLAMVANEIRSFANHLEALTNDISAIFQKLVEAAEVMRDQAEEAGKVDAGQSLSASLDCVRVGGQRMREGIAGLDRDAATIGEILQRTTQSVDCDADIGDALGEAVARLGGDLAEDAVVPPETAPAALGEILDMIAATYTMAREREVHRRFVALGDVQENSDDNATVSDDDDDFDDGLF